jgi:hypothetical protein
VIWSRTGKVNRDGWLFWSSSGTRGSDIEENNLPWEWDTYEGNVYEGNVYEGNVYEGNVYEGNVYEGNELRME